MELKLRGIDSTDLANRLLIVPYGIETNYEIALQPSAPALLIVPYGIETLLAY